MSIDHAVEDHGHSSGNGGHGGGHSDGNGSVAGPLFVAGGAVIGLLTGGPLGLGIGALAGYGAAKATGVYYH
ncbi:hypothetical protein HYU14_02380 [Candidatus Woesearchaeota archaeon]|nr:hypothetical protein [Candidatus Woesearchaeota archaeon]